MKDEDAPTANADGADRAACRRDAKPRRHRYRAAAQNYVQATAPPAPVMAIDQEVGPCRMAARRLPCWCRKRSCAVCDPRLAQGNGLMQRFEGTGSYVATQDLRVAVNAAIALERPLLVKGEPGTGKTILAPEVAKKQPGPHHLAHQVDHQGAAGALTNTTRCLGCATANSATSGCATSPRQLRQARQIVGRLRRRHRAGATDRRDRQGRHRVPQRSTLHRARPDGVLCLRAAQIVARQRPIVMIYLEQREEGAAGPFLRRCFFLHPATSARRWKRSMKTFPTS